MTKTISIVICMKTPPEISFSKAFVVNESVLTLNGLTSLKGIENQKKSVDVAPFCHCFAPTQQLFNLAAHIADATALFFSGVSTMAIRELFGHPCSPHAYSSLNAL